MLKLNLFQNTNGEQYKLWKVFGILSGGISCNEVRWRPVALRGSCDEVRWGQAALRGSVAATLFAAAGAYRGRLQKGFLKFATGCGA